MTEKKNCGFTLCYSSFLMFLIMLCNYKTSSWWISLKTKYKYLKIPDLHVWPYVLNIYGDTTSNCSNKFSGLWEHCAGDNECVLNGYNNVWT